MENKTRILSIIYSFIAIPLICLLAFNLFIILFSLLIDFFLSFDFIIVLVVELIPILVLILPYILLIINKRKKSNSLSIGIFVYELILFIITLSLIFLFVFIWPTIRNSINNCWCMTKNSDGSVTKCCN